MRNLLSLLLSLNALLSLTSCSTPTASAPLAKSRPAPSLDSFVPAAGAQASSARVIAGEDVPIEGCWQHNELANSFSKYVKVSAGSYTLTTKNDIGGLMAPAPVLIKGDRHTLERAGGGVFVSRFSLLGESLSLSPTAEGPTIGPGATVQGTSTFRRVSASNCNF